MAARRTGRGGVKKVDGSTGGAQELWVHERSSTTAVFFLYSCVGALASRDSFPPHAFASSAARLLASLLHRTNLCLARSPVGSPRGRITPPPRRRAWRAELRDDAVFPPLGVRRRRRRGRGKRPPRRRGRLRGSEVGRLPAERVDLLKQRARFRARRSRARRTAAHARGVERRSVSRALSSSRARPSSAFFSARRSARVDARGERLGLAASTRGPPPGARPWGGGPPRANARRARSRGTRSSLSSPPRASSRRALPRPRSPRWPSRARSIDAAGFEAREEGASRRDEGAASWLGAVTRERVTRREPAWGGRKVPREHDRSGKLGAP